MLSVKSLKQSCWLIDSTATIHICNNEELGIKYTEKLIKVGRSMADKVSPNRKKVKIRLVKNNSESLVLTLINIFYLLNSSSNLISLSLFNDAKIYHYNKDQTLYD